MNQPNLPPDETTHSFVLRLWQETPGQWRGTIRHVQSDSRLAFLKLDQAMRWVERYLTADQASVAPDALSFPAWLSAKWAARPRFVASGLALAGGLALLALVVWLAPTPSAPLAGAAIGADSSPWLTPFLLGLVLGSGLVLLWWRVTTKR